MPLTGQHCLRWLLSWCGGKCLCHMLSHDLSFRILNGSKSPGQFIDLILSRKSIFYVLKTVLLVVKRKSASMFSGSSHQWEKEGCIGLLCSSPRFSLRWLSHIKGVSVPTHHMPHTQSSTSLFTLGRKESHVRRNLNPLCPSAQCSHLFCFCLFVLFLLLSLENIKFMVHPFLQQRPRGNS